MSTAIVGTVAKSLSRLVFPELTPSVNMAWTWEQSGIISTASAGKWFGNITQRNIASKPGANLSALNTSVGQAFTIDVSGSDCIAVAFLNE